MNIYKRLRDFVLLLLSNRSARLDLSLLLGTLLNLAYISGNAASALIYRSVWSATVTAYHLMLIIIRVYILSSGKASRDGEGGKRALLRVGVLLFFLDLASGFMMVYTIRRESFIRYSGIILLGFLIYTLYSVISSTFAMKKHSDDNRDLHFAAKCITLSTSLMSVFNLQYSVFSFLGTNLRLTGRIILLGGIIVFSIILSLSVRLIKRSREQDSQ